VPFLHFDRPWLIVAEMFEAKYVATAMSVSCQLNWGCNFIVGLIFPYLQRSLGAFSFVPFAVVLLFTIVFVIVWLPETKGTTPEELRDDIVRSLSHLMLVDDDGSDQNHSSSVGNPIDIEWRRAMDDLKQQEEEDMNRGTYNYGFQPIPTTNLMDAAPESDWQTRITGGAGT
jgi:SP family facilitated glucose transporter-like MFS transporter 3